MQTVDESGPMYFVFASLVRVPDAGVYLLGIAVFPSHNPLSHLSTTLTTAPQSSSTAIEVKKDFCLFSHFSFKTPFF